MNKTNDTTSSAPVRRFTAGFVILGLATFGAFALHGENLRDVQLAVVIGVIAGLVGGVLAAFGKRILDCVISFAVDLFVGL